MIVERDYRRDEVTIRMTSDEFRETVEWLELVDPHDAATADWRAELDRLLPAREEE